MSKTKIDLSSLDKFLEKTKKQCFKEYNNCPAIKELINNAENVTNGDYVVMPDGMLEYMISAKDFTGLPFFDEFVSMHGAYLDSDSFFLKVALGNPIMVEKTSGDYIFRINDTSTGTTVYKTQEASSYLDENEAYLLIEAYQESKGEFNDVIEIDSNGDYVKHFNPVLPKIFNNLGTEKETA